MLGGRLGVVGGCVWEWPRCLYPSHCLLSRLFFVALFCSFFKKQSGGLATPHASQRLLSPRYNFSCSVSQRGYPPLKQSPRCFFQLLTGQRVAAWPVHRHTTAGTPKRQDTHEQKSCRISLPTQPTHKGEVAGFDVQAILDQT